jgi:hypothetical protein
MSEATELILIAYKLLHKSMDHLTRSNIIKQETIAMSDGSTLTYNIDITIQTEQEHSIAYKKIKYLNNVSLIEPMELSLVALLCDCPDEEPEDDYGEAASPTIDEILTADDYPDCAE